MVASLFGSGLGASDKQEVSVRSADFESLAGIRPIDFHPPVTSVNSRPQTSLGPDMLLASTDFEYVAPLPSEQPTFLAAAGPNFGKWFGRLPVEQAPKLELNDDHGSELLDHVPVQVASIANTTLTDFENQDLSYSIGIGDIGEIEQILDAPLTPALQKSIADIETRIEPKVDWITHTIKRGDNLSSIFKKRGGTLVEAIEVAKLDDAKWLRTLRPGRKLDLQFANDGKLVALRYELDAIRYRFLKREENGGYVSAERERDYEIRQSHANGVIKSSLFQAAAQAGISDKLVGKFAGIFGWNIDFSSEIQKGDRFSLIYDEKVINGKVVGGGVIHAAEFVHDGEVYRAIRHVDEEGYESYYTPEGQSLKRAFLRSPMQFSRVTSGFSKRRYHPVLKKWRAHKGVDYGAPRGTPILATADGRITHLGRKNGYGKAIILKHGHQYSTLYAHMSRYKKGLKSGGKVRQGDVIGYVGSTGLATGPHLHYEFRLNGTHRNPLTVKLPTSNPIEKKYHADFLQHAQKWVAKLDGIEQPLLAANDISAN